VEWILPGELKKVTKCLETLTIATAYSRIAPKIVPKIDRKSGQQQTRPPKRRKVEARIQVSEDQSDQKRRELSQTLSPELIPTELNGPLAAPSADMPQLQEGNIIRGSPALHFYLHRPQTRSKWPVLIPLSPSQTLTDALRGRLVLEYPTLYVLPQGPSELPKDQFISEDEYLRECGVEELAGGRGDNKMNNGDEDNQ